MSSFVIRKILVNEWKAMWHARVPPMLLGVLIILLTMASIASHHHWEHHAQTVAEANQRSNQDWQSQPNRHPHRVSHYGDFVAKPTHLLSVIESGIIDQTGHLIYLEGHRLNSANFNPATEFTSLGRFPIITPGLVIQWFIPFMLIIAGYACIARERSDGTLHFMIGNGVRPIHIAIAKFIALFLPVISLILIFFSVFAMLVSSQPEGPLRLTLMVLGQSLYLASWCMLVVAGSWLSRERYGALLSLLVLWVCICLIFPKGLANLAQIIYPTYPRAEAEYLAEEKLKAIGDSHNPDDPHFATFKKDTLDRYGVNSIEELPVNYNGLLMQEGERLTTEVYREQQAIHQAQLQQQNILIRKLLLLSPSLALQYLQMSASGSDLAHHLAFLEQSEHRRFGLITYLNGLHTEKVHHQHDKDQRIDADFWKNAPRPMVNLASVGVSFNSIIASLAVLLFWLVMPIYFLLRLVKRS